MPTATPRAPARCPRLAYSLTLLPASADGAGALIAARVVQGAATGTATSAAGAALVDLEDPWRPGRPALAEHHRSGGGHGRRRPDLRPPRPFRTRPAVTVYVVPAVLFAVQAAAVTSTAATLTVWTTRRTAPHVAATGGSPAVIPATALTLSGVHGAGLPAVHGGAAMAGTVIAAALLAVAALTALAASRRRAAHGAHNDHP
ncbi:hypothetical protein ACIQB5_48635 [Streptomyces sp. NPDC088560]|uniref:hypothetical protein n=1 Tax=Streptomyces sp. NPDC088560 TaxID=3365868 RepID=UPI003805014B